ncbi:MAG: hypothetical protein IK144_00225 [Bacteroidaceae bacterium]|nr:hypothetical protein [Bacteroidaceae bacterium]
MKTYYQVVDVKSTNLQKESNNYVYNDGVCKIVYNFWSNGGNAGFTIENLSEEVLYVDLSNTFYIENGKAYDYYLARSYSMGKSKHDTKGTSVSAAAFGIWNVWPLKGLDGAISAQSSSSVSFGSSSNLAFAEKPIVAIPPYSLKSFSEYKIMSDVIQDCSINMLVKKNQPEGMTLTESESPVNFSNYITYRKGESGAAKEVIHNFYIGGFTNYLSSDIIKIKKYGCKKTVMKKSNDKYSPDCFYVKYDRTHPGNYSADAIGASKSSSNDMYYTVKKQK